MSDLAPEIAVEMAFIEQRLMDKDKEGMSRKRARAEIVRHMPETGALYMEYCKLEDQLYDKLKGEGASDRENSKPTRHAERERERDNEPPYTGKVMLS